LIGYGHQLTLVDQALALAANQFQFRTGFGHANHGG
jgi:hypothetical protein